MDRRPRLRKWQAHRCPPPRSMRAGISLGADGRVAQLRAQRAARVEAAAARRVDRARDVAGQDDPLAAQLRVGHRDGRHERLRCTGAPGWRNRSRAVGQLGDPPEVHDRDPVADVLDDAHVVGDEHVGQAELALERLEQVEDLGLDRHVERRHRLVADDEVRLEDERPGDADALALAAARTRAGSAGRGTAAGRPCPSSARPWRAARRRVPRPWMRRPSPMLSPIGVARVEAGVRVLEDDLHPAPVRLERRALDRR